MLDTQALKEIQARQVNNKYYWLYSDFRDNSLLSHLEAVEKTKEIALSEGHSPTYANYLVAGAVAAYQIAGLHGVEE